MRLLKSQENGEPPPARGQAAQVLRLPFRRVWSLIQLLLLHSTLYEPHYTVMYSSVLSLYPYTIRQNSIIICA